VNNEGAIDFYKKFGFEIVDTKEHYYKRIEPADAHVLQKTLRSKISNGEVKTGEEKKDNEK
jgi:ribosomal protein S18 acetylase RimI-like enzyme